MVDNWNRSFVGNAAAPGIQDRDRIEALEMLVRINYRSRRLLGETINYIMSDQVESIELLSQYLYLIALLGYRPEAILSARADSKESQLD